MLNGRNIEQKKLRRFYVRHAGFFHCIDQPYKFLCSVGDGNVVVLSFGNLLLKICTECFIPVADLLGSIDESKTQIAGTPLFHMGIRGFQLPGLIGGGRGASVCKDLIRRIKAGESPISARIIAPMR